ncbi:metallophosphoesterase family protein [Streptacidiphilus sp. N1-10]|uniref:Metallophosphoesterase family protein n=1 Tax=Streptacidiphilus jeojiensis TaxID=3229225 RepID=A0ABV6XMT8_9ACTN
MDIPRMGIPDHLAEQMSMAEQHDYLRRRFSRGYSRRGILRASAATTGALTAVGVLGSPAFAAAPDLVTRSATDGIDGSLVAPVGRHLAFGADPSTQFRISWQVPAAVKKPFLRFGRHPHELGQRIPAELRDLHTPALTATSAALDQYYLHVALDHLQPGTTYYYGVGHTGFDPADPAHAATLSTFTTAPAPRRGEGSSAHDAFTFTAFGDQGVSAHALANDNVILAQQPAFHLHAGDICYADPDGQGLESDSADYAATTWDSFLAQTETVASKIPWMVAYGNHDMEAWYSPTGYGGEEARFSLPENGPTKDSGVYSFRYGNVGVISLDANDVSYEIPANNGITSGKQTTWLERRLREFRQDAEVDFIVVFFHHCAFSTTHQHASEGGVRDAWVPLFEQYRVDLVINGHNHVYERTDAILGGKASKAAPSGASIRPAEDGVVYVTAGAAGRSLYSFDYADTYEGNEHRVDELVTYHWEKGSVKVAETIDWSRVRYTGYSFLRVDVVPARKGATAKLKLTALTESGTAFDHLTIEREAGSTRGW